MCMIIIFKLLFPKPLGQSRPNFIWSPLGKRECKFCENGLTHMTKMAAMPIYGKSNRKAMNRNWSNQKANPALKTKREINKYYK